jgi:hypothetical protein
MGSTQLPHPAGASSQLTCKRLILTHVGAQMQNRLAEVEEEVAGDGLVITL